MSVGGVVAPAVGAAVAAAPWTVTVPVIVGWIVQWYGNVPAVANVTAPVPPPPAMLPASQDASSAVAVWACASEFVHVTVSPTFTVTLAGE